MNDSVNSTVLMPNIRIGIPGLPNLTNNMVQGGLYVLIAETASARFPLFASSLGGALKDGRRCSAIVPGHPEHFIQRLETLGDLKSQGLLATGQFQLFCMQEEFSKKMFRFGAERFVSELEQMEIPENSYLVFDQADDLISLHDVSLAIEQIDIISKWLDQHKVTALLAFLRVSEAHSSTINALMDYLTGIARIGGEESGLRLGFDYWQSPDGTVAARNYQLTTLDNNCYEATLRHNQSEATSTGDSVSPELDVPPEEPLPSYFYMDADLGSLSSQVPGNWQRVDTLVGMMHATRNKRRAIAIFCYRQDTNLRQLAEAIHTLRINLGKYAQIIVQEKNASLRYQNEALLLRLGVNLVVHRDVQPARMPLMLSSVAGQIFSRDVDINFEAAMASVTSAALRGYQTPARFAREVETLQERASTLNIPYALIVAKPQPGIEMVQILNQIKLSRPGDLSTADSDSCYLFFNACQQSVILTTLERLLGGPIDTAFSEVRFQVSKDEITHELAALLHNADIGLAVDYTSAIVASAPPPPKMPAGDNEVPPPAVAVTTPLPESTTPFHAPYPASIASPRPAIAFPTTVPTAPPPDPIESGLAETPASLYAQSSQQPAVFGKRDAPRATRSASKPRHDRSLDDPAYALERKNG
ncbi:BcsE family c-di-GMP-binding protein [Curvibacter sp. APW13]|uniref:BcsE family c-di-GMP-binding protein n=1 Tax=Curvibacter sp. APW13 TaxID=3077236 RepID=UPI0028DF5A82|nr:BcsE family c-di-GMP-binding protein [Curvibacter sp. APW13]MDT8990061.1 BcsE family c-di-GMP-binding protein [Curvibacter sp. APW13]